MTGERRFTAAGDDRLDRMIAAALPELSRSYAQRLIEAGSVSVDGAAVTRRSTVVAAGAEVGVDLQPPTLDGMRAEDVPLDVIYEDEHTLVINKQPGLIVHPTPGRPRVTLVDVIRTRYPEVQEIDGSDRPGVVHRLDRDTSGVMVFAKSYEATQVLKDQWRERETLKIYLALVEGDVQPAEGIIDAPLGPDAARPGRRAVVDQGQPARTQYWAREQFGEEATLLDVRIFTGRTHQIRVHLSAVGHSVVGDVMYGAAATQVIARQALHAQRLGFTLASTGEWREFEAPAPADMLAAIETVRARHRAATEQAAG